MKDIMIWFLLCGGYGVFTWAAGKRRGSAEAVLSFLDGWYLALLCFAILPCAMGTDAFYLSVAASVFGVGSGFLLERKKNGQMAFCVLLFAALTAVQFLYTGEMDSRKAVLLAFFGGMGLYHACAGILPEGVHPKEHIGGALLSVAGFLLGTVTFAGFL